MLFNAALFYFLKTATFMIHVIPAMLVIQYHLLFFCVNTLHIQWRFILRNANNRFFPLQLVDEDSILMTLNDLIDHIDYITNKDGMQTTSILERAKLRLDLARQTIRLESAVVPEIRVDLQKVLDNVHNALKEDSDNVNLKTALVRLKGTMYDLSNI